MRRLAQTEIDDKNRTQIPLVVRKLNDLKKSDSLVWWELDEHMVLTKLGTGTPLPPSFRPFQP